MKSLKDLNFLGQNLLKLFKEGGMICYVRNVFEERWWDGVFKFEGSGVDVFSDGWVLGWISIDMYARV